MTGPPGQRWDPATYAANARFVPELGLPVLDLLAPQPHEHILDLGCGDGLLTLRLAATGAKVIGVDSSPEQIKAARKRGLDARILDASQLAFIAEFDAVFSNAALHWMRSPDLVIEGVYRALKPGGRFVGEMGGEGNVAQIASALVAALRRRNLAPDLPWYFPGAEEYRRRLERTGFTVAEIALIPRPTPLPGDITAWLETFAVGPLERLDPADRPAFLDEVRERLRPRLQDEDGRWTADYVRLRFRATKPGS